MLPWQFLHFSSQHQDIQQVKKTKTPGHDHSAMKAPEGKTEAKAQGVINKIDAEKKSINITHEPVESLGWPKMTMDLPVTKRVDLSTVKTGEKVEFTLKQGRDKQYRVIGIEAAK